MNDLQLMVMRFNSFQFNSLSTDQRCI